VKLIHDVSFACLRAFQQPPPGTVVSAAQTASYQRKLVMVDEVVAKLMKDGIALLELFSKERTHSQLVQRTEQLLRLLMAKGQLTAETRELIWHAGELNDGDMQVDLYKVLAGAAVDMLPEDRLFFMDKVLSVPMAEIIDREVELVTEICTSLRGRAGLEETAQKGTEFLWRIVMEVSEQTGVAIVNRAQMGFSDILKGQSMEVKLKYVDLLAESVKDEKQGFLAIKILARLLKIAFDGKTGHPEIENLSDLIDYLEKKHDLLNNIFKNLTDYMVRVAKEFLKMNA